MTQEKPSRNEDEYFVKQDAELLQKRKAELEAAAEAAERKSHFMRCPKCGGNLRTEEFHGVQLDRCGDCHGLWLDAGEIDALVAHEDHGVIRRVLTEVVGSLRGGKR